MKMLYDKDKGRLLFSGDKLPDELEYCEPSCDDPLGLRVRPARVSMALFWDEQQDEDVTIHCRDEELACIFRQWWRANGQKAFLTELREWHGITEESD